MEENHSEKERTHPLSVDRSFPMLNDMIKTFVLVNHMPVMAIDRLLPS